MAQEQEIKTVLASDFAYTSLAVTPEEEEAFEALEAGPSTAAANVQGMTYAEYNLSLPRTKRNGRGLEL